MTKHYLNLTLRQAWAGRYSSAQGQQGLTLIECLVAIIVAGLIGSAIAPALVISVATRVQSQKAEQALTLAQSELDRVRLLIERGEATVDNVPDSVPFAGAYDADDKVALVEGPEAGDPEVRDPSTPTYFDAFETFQVDLSGNQFAVQAYRTPGRVVGNVPITFSMGVRVYDIEAVQTGVGNLSGEPASLGMVGGQGERASRPLVALYTNITASENGSSLCSYIQQLDGGASVPIGCN